jgi:Holliday junction resolvasome RuvABC endonuclease subunit
MTIKTILANNKPNNICSIDASTNSLAFAIFTNSSLMSFGKINFKGTDVYSKVRDAVRKTHSLFSHFNIDAVVIEQTVYLNSPKTMLDLTMIHGAIISGIGLRFNIPVKSVPPITWQTNIGNGKLSALEKQKIRKDNPDKSDSWYKNFERDFRKQKTINFVNTYYDKNILDNDVADSIGIGHYAIKNMSKLF